MIIPVKCFTCGMVLADKYRFWLEEVRKRKLAKGISMNEVAYLTKNFNDKTVEQLQVSFFIKAIVEGIKNLKNQCLIKGNKRCI